MDALSHRIVKGEYDVKENSEPQLLAFFKPLKDKGLSPKSCTVDGNPQVIRVLRQLWPGIIIQRCLVHVQRQGLMWCRQKPRRTDAKALRRFFRWVTVIETKAEQDQFLKRLLSWEQRYGPRIAEREEKGRVFSDLKRARSMLLKALPDMFHYLDNPSIPSTTNGLEGYFSHLKRHYRNHRGLRPEKRGHYFKWYFFLRPK
ncbi:transposase [Candidatus Falkowbacteria bacterium]|nr:transposase [Candidatus Falkowbacteria bacterium]